MKRLLILLLCIPYLLAAQKQTAYFEHIGMETGLTNLSILSLCRDSRGFLWIGTDGGGLNRYDGHAMEVYRHSEKDSLSVCDDHINNILEDREGHIWIGTNGGVSRLNPANGKCEHFTPKNGRLRGGYGSLLFRNKKGQIWVGNHGSLSWFDSLNRRFVAHPAIDSTEVLNYASFDTGGRLWAGTLNGIRMIEPGADTALHITTLLNGTSGKPKDLGSTGVHIDASNNIWVTTWGNGLLRLNPESFHFEQFIWVPKPKFPGMANVPAAVAETFDSKGNRTLWIAADHGLFKFPLPAQAFPDLRLPHEHFDDQLETGLPLDRITALLADSGRNIWTGTSTNGLYRYNTRQENFQTLKNTKNGGISQISFAWDGTVIVTGMDDPLALFDQQLRRKKVFHRFSPQMDISEGRVSWEAAKDEESGILYVGTFDGLVAYDEKTNRTRVFRYNPEDSTGLLWRKIINVFPVGNNRLLLGFWKRHLQLFDARVGKSIKVFSKQNIIIRRIKKTTDGQIWICTESGLLRYDPVGVEMDTVIPPSGRRLWDIHRDTRSRYWLGTDKGLWLFDARSGHITAKYGVEQGLPGNDIYAICEDKLGRLWLMTELGLCFFDPETHRSYTIGQSEGLLFGNNAYVMNQSPDGRIWLAWQNQIQRFWPELVETPKPSRIYITGLKINEKDTLPDIPFEQIPEIRLRPGQNALTFSYTAIDLESFRKTNFLYRLEGLQNDWVRAGKNRTAAFVNLPAGVYTFRVRPEDAGDSAAFDAVLRVRVTDFFWQRAWFRALVLVLLSAFTVFAYNRWTNQRLRLRLADLERERALENLRLDIAQDIHDEVGSALTKISLSAQFAAMLPELTAPDFREKLRQIGAEARNVALQLGEIVFAINPRYDRFGEVQAYFREKGREFLEEAQISSRFDLPPAPGNPAVPPHVKRQLYMLYRECLNNIVKHAGAQSVGITFRLDENERNYLLEIRDDGKGFDPENTRRFGSGLKGMHTRAEKIGAVLEIETAPGKGTLVRVRGEL